MKSDINGTKFVVHIKMGLKLKPNIKRGFPSFFFLVMGVTSTLVVSPIFKYVFPDKCQIDSFLFFIFLSGFFFGFPIC